MLPLTARDVLEAWEEGRRAAGDERVSPALARALPGAAPEDLERLPLGRRDALLLTLHRVTFGARLDLQAHCPSCGEGSELALRADELLAGADVSGPELDAEPKTFERVLGDEADAVTVRFRLTTAADLRAAAQAADAAGARRVLVERLVAETRRGEESIASADLEDEEIRRLSVVMAAADPLAEILLDLDCPACGRDWKAVLDVADCLWRRVAGTAQTLLREVHVLARSYGWREADVLALDAGRRRAYLEMTAGREGKR